MTAVSPSFNDQDFRRIVDIAAVEAGLAIPSTKKSLVQSRVARRMRALGMAKCGDYLDQLDADPSEKTELISVLTTNVSHFYREKHHFDHISKNILGTKPRNLRFWSAGCSNGQEPYSLAFDVLMANPDAAKQDVLILASDIDAKVIEKAKAGIYSESEIAGIEPHLRDRFLQSLGNEMYQVRDEPRKLIRFRQLNLNAPWPMAGKFDAIMCRNVVIYFSDETQAALWPRFRDALKENGTLMLGHSERIHPLDGSGFETAGITTYRKL